MAELGQQGILVEGGKRVYPMMDYVFIELIEDNPYITKKTQSGLILPHSGLQLSQETGNIEKQELGVQFARVVAAGPKCQNLQVGDEVYLDRRGAQVLPILDGGYRRVHEQNILSFIR